MTTLEAARKLCEVYGEDYEQRRSEMDVVIETADVVLWGMDQGDTWLVWLAVGDLRAIPALIPSPKKWVAFWRSGQPRRYEFNKLISRLHHGRFNFLARST